MSSANEAQNTGPPETVVLAVAEAEPGGPAAIPVTTGWPGWTRWRSLVALRSFLIFLLLWWLVALWINRPIQLPSPFRVAAALGELTAEGEVFDNALISI